jgi:hypothetical protein
MNLLISLMSNTFATDTAHGRQIWWFEFAALVLCYEARLSEDANQRYRCGTFIRQRTLERGKQKKTEWRPFVPPSFLSLSSCTPSTYAFLPSTLCLSVT